MRLTVARRIDEVSHLLYRPAMLGRKASRARWLHRIHLIPASLHRRICDWYERLLTGGPEVAARRPEIVMDPTLPTDTFELRGANTLRVVVAPGRDRRCVRCGLAWSAGEDGWVVTPMTPPCDHRTTEPPPRLRLPSWSRPRR